jgi:hypothetical protein
MTNFDQKQYFFSIQYSIPKKSLMKRFAVKWQTNILEQFSVFTFIMEYIESIVTRAKPQPKITAKLAKN